MPGYIVRNGYCEVPGFGTIHVLPRRNARNVSARWKGGQLHVTVPLNFSYDELCRILGELAPRIEQKKPDALYFDGQHLDFADFIVDITVQHHVPDKVIANFDGIHGSIAVGSRWDMASPDTIRTVSRFMCHMAQRVAPSVLIPRARILADTVGRRPLLWEISNGHRTLGHCSSKGVIALSYALMFYPGHLRDYVIYHELSHLSEMNHSARFHQICDSYCQGREAELEAELRAFPLPIVR